MRLLASIRSGLTNQLADLSPISIQFEEDTARYYDAKNSMMHRRNNSCCQFDGYICSLAEHNEITKYQLHEPKNTLRSLSAECESVVVAIAYSIV